MRLASSVLLHRRTDQVRGVEAADETGLLLHALEELGLNFTQCLLPEGFELLEQLVCLLGLALLLLQVLDLLSETHNILTSFAAG